MSGRPCAASSTATAQWTISDDDPVTSMTMSAEFRDVVDGTDHQAVDGHHLVALRNPCR